MYKRIMFIVLFLVPIKTFCQEAAETTPKVTLQEITLKDTSNYLVPFSFDSTLSIGDIKEKIAHDLTLPTSNFALELVQKGTLKGTGKLLSENATRFNHYQPLVQAGYTELLVYSTTEPDIKLDPKKKVATEALSTPTKSLAPQK
jgi:hypothetical protein